jgi:hypothetical protein
MTPRSRGNAVRHLAIVREARDGAGQPGQVASYCLAGICQSIDSGISISLVESGPSKATSCRQESGHVSRLH